MGKRREEGDLRAPGIENESCVFCLPFPWHLMNQPSSLHSLIIISHFGIFIKVTLKNLKLLWFNISKNWTSLPPSKVLMSVNDATPQFIIKEPSVQFSLVAQSCPTLCDPMNRSTPGLPVHHQLPELTQSHVHRIGDAIQPSHPLSSPSPPACNPSPHQSLFQWVNSSHEVAKVLEFQL